MSNRIYIDSYAYVGMRGPKDVEAQYETEVLLDEMEWAGIHGALITHSTAKEYDPMYGNRMLARELKKSPRLYGVWAVMPHQTGEFPRPGELIKELQDNNIKAVRMCPRSHRFPFHVDFCGELLGALEEEGVLLMVEGGHLYVNDVLETPNQVLVSELDAVLTRFPRLNVLLQGGRWDATRFMYTLMAKHRNLYVELSAHQGNRAMEVFSGWFGAGRVLFGTGALEKSPGAAKSFVDYCTLSEEEKASVAGLNIARLARIDTLPPPYRRSKRGDPILALAKEGKPLKDILVIDSHAHLMHTDAGGTGFIHIPYGDDKSIVERAKLMGMDAACISGFLAVWTDYREGNKIVHDAMTHYPRFYHGYASLQPQYVKDWPRELRKVHVTYGMEGIKAYNPRTYLPYNDKLWKPWYEYGNRMNAYALIHPSPNVVPEMMDIAPRYPNISFIMAHSGGSFKDARLAIEIAQKNPNVFLEITLTAVTYRVIEFMVKHVGADRVLFGTDQPMRDPIPQFGWMVYSHCTFEEKKKMLGLNMKKIIRRVKK